MDSAKCIESSCKSDSTDRLAAIEEPEVARSPNTAHVRRVATQRRLYRPRNYLVFKMPWRQRGPAARASDQEDSFLAVTGKGGVIVCPAPPSCTTHVRWTLVLGRLFKRLCEMLARPIFKDADSHPCPSFRHHINLEILISSQR